MARADQHWQHTTAQFYGQLYTCVWQNLRPFLEIETALALLLLSRTPLQESYPFLSRLHWSADGLDTASLAAAIAAEEQAHVQAGCEQLLQNIQSLTHSVGGELLAQRVRAATEQLRLAFEPAFSHPTPAEEVEPTATPADPEDAALPLLQSMGKQALSLYTRGQELETALNQTRKAVQRSSPAARQDMAAEIPAPVKELARSEALYHGLFDLSPDGVIVVNTAGTILQANLRAAEILELDKPEDLVGRDVVQFYAHPEERVLLLDTIARYQRLEGQRREMHTRRGRTIITTSSTRLIDYEGQPCLLSVIRDVTERARLHQEMEDFAYSASHDLQAPLRTFEGYARWLLEDYGDALDETGQQLCKEIIDDALHMKKLLYGLLEYSRIGRVHTQAVAVDVRQVLERVLHDLQIEILHTGARISFPDTLPTVVYSEVRLTQIFSNLLSNAMKFTKEKAPEVSIGHEEQERYHRFSVHDNGIGIAPEHFGRIFEIFKRLHTREEYPGTGAGLTIVKKIVEAHGGTIGVESTPGVGSTFWFTIPKTEGPS